MAAKPNLAGVLASVVPGRVVRLAIEGEQKRALRDHEGKLALDVPPLARSSNGKRGGACACPLSPDRTDLPGGCRSPGISSGNQESSSPAAQTRGSGGYPSRGLLQTALPNRPGGSGFRVLLYRLVSKRRRPALSRKRLSAGLRASSPRARVRWWKHPLFGDYEGRPPPQWTKSRRQQTASQDEYEAGVRLRPDCKP